MGNSGGRRLGSANDRTRLSVQARRDLAAAVRAPRSCVCHLSQGLSLRLLKEEHAMRRHVGKEI